MLYVKINLRIKYQGGGHMSKYQILYNPKANNNRGEEKLDSIPIAKEEQVLTNVLEIEDPKAFFDSIDPDDKVVIVGGDGTLNHFVNECYDIDYPNQVYLYAAGTGNDFLNDIGKPADELVEITKYLKHLPVVSVNGKDYRFINGIGYGIDGYCCEVGDKMREAGEKKIDYTGIAIKGLLFHYKPTHAKVTVDGVTKEYDKTWIAPTMNGRCYGGGMYPTPDQDRLNNDEVSCMVMYGKGKIRTLIAFPKIFKGEHVKYKNMVEIRRGKEVAVEFDRPVALQIDGETILNVTSYSVRSAGLAG